MKVVFYQRKPRPNKNFSIEILFDRIRSQLPKEIVTVTEISKYYSKGLIKRIYITMDAAFKQGDVNHVTGDVNFLTIFLKKKKTVLTVLDLGLLNHSNPLARKILKIFWIQLPVKRAGYVTTISAATKTELLKHVNVSENKVRVMYIPVADLMEYKPKPFNESKPVILQIGTKDNKNLIRLTSALKGISCHLSIVGELNEQQLNALASSGVEYTNVVNISNEELKEQYEKSDLLAFVSTYEGFGMPIVEAQIVGRPVITSNLLSMPEVANDGALLVDPYNVEEIRTGIQKIINDSNYREDLIENGKSNAKRFSVDTITKQYELLYREIVNQYSS